MALQVWLPLNGELENQGLAEVSVVNTGAVVDSAGKIGSCYACKTNEYIDFTCDLGIVEKFSIAFWIKTPCA